MMKKTTEHHMLINHIFDERWDRNFKENDLGDKFSANPKRTAAKILQSHKEILQQHASGSKDEEEG